MFYNSSPPDCDAWIQSQRAHHCIYTYVHAYLLGPEGKQRPFTSDVEKAGDEEISRQPFFALVTVKSKIAMTHDVKS